MVKKATIGIEIGSDRLKMVEARESGIENYAVEDLPDGVVREGAVVQWEAMAEFLRDALKKHGFGTKHASLSLPAGAAYVRRVRMPAMTPQQLEVNLPYEFHDFISDDKENYIYDYSMIGLVRDDQDEVREMDLLGVAVSKQLMRSYIQMFKTAGMKLVEAAPECRSIENTIRKLNPELMKQDFAILDLGYGASNINIYSSGIYMVTRNIETACRQIIDVVADQMGCDPHIAELYMRDDRNEVLESEKCQDVYDRIAIDVMRAINYYTFENQNNTLETLYYCGGGSMILPLVSSIADSSPLTLAPLSSITRSEMHYGEALMNAPAALGICWND